jgi:predicted NBD/HSP70 family sugar kinase
VRLQAHAEPAGRSVASQAFEVICHAPCARRDLARELGASLSTVTAAVQRLRRLGLISESADPNAAYSGGRPPMTLDLAPDLGSVLAASMGPNVIRAAAADVRGAVVARATVPTPSTPTAVRSALRSALTTLAENANGPARAVSVAVPGRVNPSTEEISIEPSFSAWPSGHPRTWLRGFDVPVMVANQADLAAVGEHAAAPSRHPGPVLFVVLANYIGARLLVDGDVYNGWRGAAGEIGLMRSTHRPGDRTLGEEAGSEAIVQRYHAAGGDRRVSSAPEVFTRAREGDQAAVSALDAAFDRLAVAVANAIVVLNPATVILGGGLAEAGDALLLPMRERLGALLPSPPEIVLGELGADASVIGAASRAARRARADIVAELDRNSFGG